MRGFLLCGGAGELLYQLAANLGRNFLNAGYLAALKDLLDCPPGASGQAQKVVDLLRGGYGIAVLSVLVLLATGLLRLLWGGVALLDWLCDGLGRLDWLARGRVVEFGLDGVPHEVKDTVDFLL